MYLTYTTRMMEFRRDGFDEGFTAGREDGLQQGLQAGLQQGIEQGMKQGAYQKTLETAKTLLSMSLSPEQVAQGTSLPLETILQLVQEN